jgi:predicted GNAT family acetyltransferase
MSDAVVHDQLHQRFTLNANGVTALLKYHLEGNTIYFVHTEVPPEMEGKGIGGKLAKTGLEYARENGLKIVARCPFVASYLERHTEYQDLVAAD